MRPRVVHVNVLAAQVTQQVPAVGAVADVCRSQGPELTLQVSYSQGQVAW